MTGALLAWMQNKQEAAGFLVSGSAPHKYSPKYPPNFLQNILPNIFPISSQISLQIFFQLFSQYPSKYPPKYCLKYPTNFLYPPLEYVNHPANRRSNSELCSYFFLFVEFSFFLPGFPRNIDDTKEFQRAYGRLE